MEPITTIKQLRKAIKQAKRVFVLPVFGDLTDTYVRIAKTEARYMLSRVNAEDFDDEQFVATFEGEDLYIN